MTTAALPAVVCCSPLQREPLSAADAQVLAHTVKALADPARLRLVSLVAAHGGEACVCDLTEAVGLSQPTVSHHLKVLVDDGSDVAAWREVASVVVGGAGLLAMVAGAVAAWRAGLWATWRTTQPESALTRAQVRELHAQVRGRVAVPPERVGLARHVAQRLSRQGALLPFWSGAALLQAARLVVADDAVDLLLPALSTAGFVLLLVVLLQQARSGREFLRRHPAADRPGA